MSSPATTRTLSPALEARIKEHEKEVERLQAIFGDPEKALSDFILETFDVDSFASYHTLDGEDGGSEWEDSDDADAW